LGAVRETHNLKTKHYILLYRRNMAEILLKRRKTKNQSIQQSTSLWQQGTDMNNEEQLHGQQGTHGSVPSPTTRRI
jgi:hypothetical protein